MERLIALRRVLAKRAPTTTATTARTDRSAELAALAKRSSRVLDAYEREAIGPDELQRRLAKIDAERARIEASIAEESRAEEQARAAADPARRQELLASVRGMRAAWGEASPAERRRIVELLCERAELVTGEEPRMVWRSVEEALADVERARTAGRFVRGVYRAACAECHDTGVDASTGEGCGCKKKGRRA